LYPPFLGGCGGSDTVVCWIVDRNGIDCFVNGFNIYLNIETLMLFTSFCNYTVHCIQSPHLSLIKVGLPIISGPPNPCSLRSSKLARALELSPDSSPRHLHRPATEPATTKTERRWDADFLKMVRPPFLCAPLEEFFSNGPTG
jgi:hypothetical protein